MIDEKDLTRVGKITKTHGTEGELRIAANGCSPSDFDYLICRIDGLLVPFYLEKDGHRSVNGNIVKFEGVDSMDEAAKLCGSDVYVDSEIASHADDDELPYDFFIGFQIFNGGKPVGVIDYIDYRTANILAVVKTGDNQQLDIPFHPDFVLSINRKKKIIDMQLPEGLI